MSEVKLVDIVPKELLTKEQFDLLIRGLALSSRDVMKGDLFCAYPGRLHDGRRYIADAIEAGAAAVIVESGVPHRWIPENTDTPIIEVSGLERLVGRFAAKFYGAPAEQLQLVAITGTNGKTTCSYFISQALISVGIRCGIMGTLGSGLPGVVDADATHTTPNPIELQKQLAVWQADASVKAVAMEVSSHGLDQGRVEGCRFYTALFTNLSQDHLDYHGTMENYAEAKKQLFTRFQIAHAVINIDDPLGVELLAEIISDERSISCFAYSVCRTALPDCLARPEKGSKQPLQYIYIKAMSQTAEGVSCEVVTPLGECSFSALPIWGRFNISNLLATIATLLSFKCTLKQIEAAVKSIRPPEGRMECIYDRGPKVFIDYAHTPDAVQKALSALKEHKLAGQRLHAVIGCGGDRDVGKRSQMGKMVAQGADRITVTTDNPRFEAPESIAHPVVEGIKSVQQAGQPTYDVQLSRRYAVWRAVSAASKDDLVILLGRGHERYQSVGAVRIPLTDKALVAQAVEQRDAHARLAGDAVAVEPGQYLCLLSELAEAIGAELRGPDRIVSSVSTDTRQIEPGALFVALQGDRFDAHAFVHHALEEGAIAAVVQADRIEALEQQASSKEPGWLLVDDTRVALGLIAHYWRRALTLPTIALTGSCGKTSVKEMIAQILRQQGEVLATQGNFNNDIGVPLTLMRLRAEHQYAVIEMGANCAGEIDYTARLAEPNVALITNAAEAHLEGFGSVEGVAKAKGEIYASVAPGGVALINLDDAHHEIWLQNSAHLNQVTFSADLMRKGEDQADVQLVGVEKSSGQKDCLTVKTARGLFTFILPLLGRHQWSNALVAIAAAESVGISEAHIIAGLESLVPIKGRLYAQVALSGLTVIDDTYNANPHSVRAAIDLLSECDGPSLLILGMMAEMGEGLQEGYEGVGRYMVELNRTQAEKGRRVDAMIVVGEGGEWVERGMGSDHAGELTVYADKEALIHDISLADRGPLNLHERFKTVLVKGSRSAAMEDVANALKAAGSEKSVVTSNERKVKVVDHAPCQQEGV